ncbi:MAG TPA: cupin domain-containing protein [Planctomycetota bacterium]|nr:cupin domain-containing protein [Planctomycetota bacterium]
MIPRSTQKTLDFANCHEGRGIVRCTVVLNEGKADHGFQFVHDDVLEPGASIGVHSHIHEEELYYFIEGTGVMIEDGVRHAVGPGDISVTRRGHSHGLENNSEKPLRFIVVCTRAPEAHE